MAPLADARNADFPPLSPRAKLAWRRAADELLIASIFGGCEPDERAQRPAAPAETPAGRRRVSTPAF